MAEGDGLTRPAASPRRVGAALAAYAVVLIGVETALAVLGFAVAASDGASVVLRFSATVGVVLMLALLVLAGARSRTGVSVVLGLAVLRVVVVVAAVLIVGSDATNGRADGSYLALGVMATGVALAAVVVAVAFRRALGRAR